MIRRFNSIYLLCIACVLSLFISCEDEKDDNELNSGQLIGFIGLVDIDNHEIKDRSGVEIILDNGSSKISTQSDDTGRFSFNGLEASTYNVVYKKDEFYEHIIQGFGFAGGNEPVSLYEVYLYSIHEAQIDSLRFLDFDIYMNSNQLEAYATISNDNQKEYPYFIYYLSNTPDVSYKNYLTYNNYSDVMDGVYRATVYVDPKLFPVGSTLYMIVYPATRDYQNTYYSVYKGQYLDLETGQTILTSVNKNMPSNVASFVVPEKNK